MSSARLVLAGALGGCLALAGAVAVPVLADSSGPLGVPGPPVTPVPASAPTRLGSLSPAHPILNFNGAVTNPTPFPLVNNPSPEVCGAECQEYQFTVAPAAARTPFLASLKNTVTGPGGTYNADDGFDLYVYDPAGHLVGSQNGIGSNGESVLVRPGGAGRYTIVVTFTFANDTNAAWVGEVRLLTPATWQPAPATCGTVSGVTACFELPRLRALAPYDVVTSGVPPATSTPAGYPFPFSFPTSTSCYLDETVGLDNPSATAVEHPVTRCLRFTSDVQNTGAGPLTVGIPAAATGAKGQSQVGYLPGQCHAVQFVSTSRGRTVSRPAGDCQFHLEHGHFHYDALIGYSLHAANPDGSIGRSVSVSSKESFCLADDDYFGYGTPGPNGPRENVGQPGCNAPQQVSAPTATPGSGTYVEEGITPGWGDVYTWDTPDQYIDITHVASGTYWIVEKTNPAGAILVSGPAQTCSATELRLTQGSQSASVTVLASRPAVACPAG
ncbi:MAG TPA: hypothetical protein VFA11_09050 [Acidimicrobiales bacterium]|nr:hypothetical protein [Acidimicrobiales bacterium]